MRTQSIIYFGIPLCLAALSGSTLAADALAQPPSYTVSLVPEASQSGFGLTAHVSEPAGPLKLSQAVALALSSNPDLSASNNELGAYEGIVTQAGIVPNPELATLFEDRQKTTRTTTVQINQKIELGGKRSARINVAERGRDFASADLAAKRADIYANVVTAFFEVLAAQERVKIAQALADLAQRTTQNAARRVMAGKISPVEETKARVAEASVRVEFAQAKSDLLSARKRLSALWGNPSPRFTAVDGQTDLLPELPTAATLEKRFAGSPSLMRARLELDRRVAMVDLENARRIPDLTLSLGNKHSEELGRNQAILGVSIPIPVFDRNQGNQLEALRRRDKAKDELMATEMRLSNELATAYEQLKTSRLEAEALKNEILPGAQSAFDAASKGFELGKFNFLEVLDAQRTLFQAKSQYLKALTLANRSAADIERVLGEAAPANRPQFPQE